MTKKNLFFLRSITILIAWTSFIGCLEGSQEYASMPQDSTNRKKIITTEIKSSTQADDNHGKPTNNNTPSLEPNYPLDPPPVPEPLPLPFGLPVDEGFVDEEDDDDDHGTLCDNQECQQECENSCQVGFCKYNQCVCAPAEDNTPCDDNNACSQTDTCQGGFCTGTNPITCSAQDQCHDAGVCDPMTGSCSNPNKADGASCDDANLCTQTDTCQSGTCTGANSITCSAQDTCHDAGVCNPSTGVCSNPPKPDGTSCADSNLCTQTDTCLDGVCSGQNPVECAPLNQCYNVGQCNDQTGQCEYTFKDNGTACDDNNACTQSDTCQDGSCTGASPVICSAQDQCHTSGTCDTVSGICSNPSKPDGSSCDDTNACTQTDTCQSGSCSGTNPVVCTALDQCHDIGTCDSMTGLCSNPSKPNGSSCDDLSACTQTDTCQGGSCSGTNPVVCTALDQCHDIGTCDSMTGICSNPSKPNDSSCDDTNACTQTDTCQNGSCSGTNPVVCTALDQCHDIGTCDSMTGLCSNPTKSNGTTCSNSQNTCPQTDTCQNGSCVDGLITCTLNQVNETCDGCATAGCPGLPCTIFCSNGAESFDGTCRANGTCGPIFNTCAVK